MEKSGFMNKFTNFAMKLGEQIHLRTLRDAFAVTMPFFILAGVSVLINSVVFPWILSGESLTKAQYWSQVINNSTLNVSGLLLAPIIGYQLSINRGYKNPIAAAGVAISALVVMMPNAVSITPTGASEAVNVTGVLTYANLGTQGMFAGIIIGLLATEFFIKVTRIRQLEINLGEGVPPAVGRSFAVMLPVMIVISSFAALAFVLNVFFDTTLIALIAKMIQEPLRAVNTSLFGVLFIYSFGNFLFTMGIHQTIVNGVILMPLLLINMNENVLSFAEGTAIPHIMTSVMVPTFGMMGGTGSTIALLIATILFGKSKSNKNIANLALAPGIFNINEPVIFGYPIVFNIPMMIPFVLLPAIGVAIAYFATAWGLMNYTTVLIPWTTPPLISGYLATAGDWRAIVVQAIIIIIGVFLYLPFMRMSEKISMAKGEE